MNIRLPILTCKLCGDKRERGNLKCKYCQAKQFKKHQRELVRKEKKKEKKANSPKRLKTLCDKLWREKVIERYGNKCVLCGSDKINIHHIVGRRNMSTRWAVINGVPLCALHHTFGTFSAHQNPLTFHKEMVAQRGDKWEKDLIKMSNKIWDKRYEVIEP